jgi:hypothetical protein
LATATIGVVPRRWEVNGEDAGEDFFERCFQFAFHAEKNMAFLAPMIREIAGGILHHPHSNLIRLLTKETRAPISYASFASVLCSFNFRPVRRAERKCIHFHSVASCISQILMS